MNFYERFFPKGDIIVTPNLITFNFKRGSESIEPVIYLKVDETGARPIAIGAAQGVDSSAIKVHLFESQNLLIPPPDKFNLLANFLEYGIVKIYLSKNLIPSLRPVIHLHGIDNFEPIFHGYQREIFSRALMKAGAKMVIIED